MNRPMRILFITNLYPPYHLGGYEIACKDIAEGFRRKGHIIKVLTSMYGIKKRRENKTVARALDITLKLNVSQTLNEKRKTLFFNSSNYKITKGYVSDFDPDIVSFWNINGISASTIYAVERLGVPKVFQLFDRSLSYLAKEGIKGFISNLYLWHLRINNLIASSSELRSDYIKKGFNKATISVIHHGIELDKYPARRKDISGRIRLLYVGQLWDGKGVHLLLQAVCSLKKCGVDTFLTVIGKGDYDYEKYLRVLCSQFSIGDHVRFLDWVGREKLIHHYHNNHIFILPSIVREGLGIVLLESMATSTPVIASRQGGPLDIVRDGETGYFFEPNNVQDLAKKIMILNKDRNLISQMGKNARKSVEDKFNIKSIIEEIEIYYRRVIEKKEEE